MTQDKGEGLAAAGWILVVVGILGALYGLLADPSVETGVGGSYGMPDRVTNLHAMQQLANIIVLSGFVFLAGVILCGLASVVRALPVGDAVPTTGMAPEAVAPHTAGDTAPAQPATAAVAPEVTKVTDADDTWIYWMVGGFVALLIVAYAIAGITGTAK